MSFTPDQLARAIVEGSRDAIFSHDFDGIIWSWNRGAQELYGYSAEEIIGTSLSRLIPDDLHEDTRLLHEQLRAGQPLAEFDATRLHRSGRCMTVRVSASPIYDEAGRVVGVSKIDKDISEQIATHERLIASEHRFRATFDNAAVGIAHVTLDGYFLHFNQRFVDLFGYTREELHGMTAFEITHPDEVEASVKMAKALREGDYDSCQVEKRYIHKSGEVVWSQLTTSLVRASEGKPAYFVSVVQDIRERMRLAKALEESEARVRNASKVAGIGSFEWNIRDGISISSPELEALYGLPPGSFHKNYDAWRHAIHPGDLSYVEQCIAEAFQNGSLHAEWRTVWPDGSVHWLEARGVVDLYEDDKPVRMIGVNLDVSDRHKAEEALRSSEERYRLAVEGGELGTWTFDPSTGDSTWDERTREIYGYDPAGTISEEFATKTIHPDYLADVQESFNRCLSEGTRFFAQPQILRGNGDMGWVRIWGALQNSRAGQPMVVGVVQDITGYERAKRELEAANRRKDDYMAMLSHELRNPLSAIRSAGELIRLRGSGPEGSNLGLGPAAKILERQSAHMAALLDGLLDVSRINRGKLSINPCKVDLVELLQALVSDRVVEVDAKELILQLELPPADSLILNADPARMTQVFDNLLANAFKFTPPGGTILLRAEVASQVPPKACVTIRDTGEGFDEALGETLFDAFQQGPQDLSRHAGGLGLGLFLAKRISEMHGGEIVASSEGQGRGASFSVTLPLHNATAVPPPPLPQQQPRAKRATGLKIVVVEDNEDAAEMLGYVLEQAGNEVSFATNGEDGIRLVSDISPDVVLCDIGLPGPVSGYDFARHIRGNPETRDLYLVALTGYGRPEDKRRCLEAGFSEHLTKPVAAASIFESLDRVRQKRDH